MKFKFIFKNEYEWKELKNIVKAEAIKAFPPEMIYCFCENYASRNGPAVYLEVDNYVYFNDIETSKEKMYKMENRYMTDFISEVKENLSFVPTIEVE